MARNRKKDAGAPPASGGELRPGQTPQEGYYEDDYDRYDEDLAAKRAGVGCLVVFLVAIVLIGGLLFWGWRTLSSEISGKNATATGTVTIKVEQGDGGRSIGAKLKNAGMIGDKSLFGFVDSDTIFRFYVRFGDSSAGFQQGTFELTPGMSYDEIIEALSEPPAARETVRVTFPEGRTVWQFGRVLEDAGLCTQEEFIKEANNIENYTDIAFFAYLQWEDNTYMRAEGYLAPDTYEFYVDDDVETIVRRLYEQFNTNLESMTFTSESGEEISVYEKMEERGLSLRETITLASIVEKEASGIPDHKPAVARVFWNRLTMEGSNVPKTLGSDVTLYYIRDFISRDYDTSGYEETQWWKAVQDQNPDLFYAYYTGDDSLQPRVGLTAGPICNPNVDAIRAALEPANTVQDGDQTIDLSTKIYFLTDLYGNVYYADEYWEHEQNIATMNQMNAQYEADNPESSGEGEGAEDGAADDGTAEDASTADEG